MALATAERPVDPRPDDRIAPGGPPGSQIWTIGHGTRPVEELIALLQDAGVEAIVDVRRFPGSRRNPQYGRDRIAEELSAAGIAYDWEGEALGGRRRLERGNRHAAWRNEAFRAYAGYMETEPFRAGVARLEAAAWAGARLAIMCAETTWWRCHRRLIADALVLDGFAVRHLIDRAPGQAHLLQAPLRREVDGAIVHG